MAAACGLMGSIYMAKNALLPDSYKDSITQTGIMYALKEYEVPGAEAVVNPNTKWNLHKAWARAEELLPRTHWQNHHDDESEYELSADSDEEVERLNQIIAGIVAYQIMNPKDKIFLRHIEHKKGGEVTLVISALTGELLKRKFPMLLLPGETRHEEEGGKKHFLDYLKIWKKRKTS